MSLALGTRMVFAIVQKGHACKLRDSKLTGLVINDGIGLARHHAAL